MKKADLERAIIETVLSKLTEPQKDALLWLPADGSNRKPDDTPRLDTTLRFLEAKAILPDVEVLLVRRTHPGTGVMTMASLANAVYRLTSIGQKVRAELARPVAGTLS